MHMSLIHAYNVFKSRIYMTVMMYTSHSDDSTGRQNVDTSSRAPKGQNSNYYSSSVVDNSGACV